MGTSHPETKPWIINKIISSRAKSVLDIGAGSGTYADFLKDAGYRGRLDAVEVWNDYIIEYGLEKKYNVVYAYDVRDHDEWNYDVIIFGDILEHMSKEDALVVWEKARSQAKYGVIAIPIIHYHQGAINNNPYEEHVKDDWSHEEVLASFPSIVDSWEGEITGAYWADFTRDGTINP